MTILRKLKANVNLWAILSIIAVLLILLPNLHIIGNVFKEPNENWYHVQEFLLKEYVTNTLTIALATACFSVLVGTSLAWIVTLYQFPLRNFYKWGLVLPLTIPPYIAAYTYAGLLGYAGVIQSTLRNQFGVKVNQSYTDIMSIEGSIFIFTAFLFPYVYTITRSFMAKQSASLIESSRVMGRGPLETFLLVILPVSRAAIVGGASLVVLEVINDYGVVQYFGVTTFSTAIFRTWFGLGDVDTAIKLAALLMLMVFGFLILEKFLRGGQKYSYSTTKVRPITPIRLTGWQAALAVGYSSLIFGLGFLIPALQLTYWALVTYKKVLDYQFLQLMLNSLGVALGTSALIMVVALIVANYTRIQPGLISKIIAKTAVMGYSIPGAVIAIGVLVFFLTIDRHFLVIIEKFFSVESDLVLSTTLGLLVFAYLIRFIGIGFNSVEAGFEKVGLKFFEASRTLGMGITETFFKVDLKMISPAVWAGLILVFVDIMKELPLTLLLRPFNFDTLATKAYQYAGDELIQEAAIPSLIIIFISFVSVYFFHKLAEKED